MKRFIFLGLLGSSIAANSQVARQYDIVIDEIMADPTPPVSLPAAEFIEIKNMSGRAINLTGWKITSAATASGAFPNYTLPADSFLIICSNSNAALLQSYGKILAVPSFPSLDNDGTTISLISKEGRLIHAVAYRSSWYQNEVKKDGGWSLEMIDTHNPCTGISNWKAGNDLSGGTPGRKNSVDAVNNDQTPPRLLRTYSIDSITLVAVFDESLDSNNAAIPGNYSLDHNLSIAQALPQSGLFDHILLKLSSPLQQRTVYMLTVSNVKDCKGNQIGVYNKAKGGLAEEALTHDMVINEILFNPRPGAFDYVELYNRSDKIVDASKIFIASKTSTGAVGPVKKLSEMAYYIFPDQYIVTTEDAFSLQHEYLVKNPDNILALTSLPSFPDDKGIVVLTNSQGDITDEVNYDHNWHFALISDEEGISIERLDPSGSSQDRNNWHSAASTAGYATPGYKNSQYKLSEKTDATIDISPKVFSPDNDGQDDVASISYKVEESGYVANITIYDAQGRLMIRFIKNELMGLKGGWNWDGLDEKKNKLPVGVYIVYAEIFNLQGKRKSFKNTIVLARRSN